MSQSSKNRTAAVAAMYDARRVTLALLTLSVLASCIFSYPAHAQAGVFDWISSGWENKAQAFALSSTQSAASVSLPRPAMNIDPNPAKGGGDVTIVDGQALVPEEGPAGTMADIVKPKNQQISIYVVREGDTLSEIAQMFNVSANTIKWANDIPPSGTIRIGQTLTILPVTGVKYTVKKGDTFVSIAKQYGADADEIRNFNGVETLAVGGEIIIPDGEIATMSAPKTVVKATGGGSSTSYSGFYSHPLPGARRTQGVHGTNGVDLAMPIGTPVLASAAGQVIVAREGGYNGGYGNYVVIQHDNGTQTLYAHESQVIVGVGQTVVKGQVIGYVGQTGKATGPHVHFEIRGANAPRNPF